MLCVILFIFIFYCFSCCHDDVSPAVAGC